MLFRHLSQTPEEGVCGNSKVMGKTAGKGKKKLQKLGVRVKIEKAYNKKKKGTVVQQSIAAGTQVKKESVIILTVSRGGKGRFRRRHRRKHR